ncbi:recombinase family protein [Chitinophaga silvisoli]|uniref:Resolvase/invertase-type recombinase catalytic domain-containing protein n=1 Tax=Chitinophaga silvisoli TaxID=2291814 RepID=A0A3E1P2R1_9BACT|nr:recombinase family protein [Chitinophaga silvisoli]RFM34404.1 hypothetical protein DXN04_14070 [Chitinophaga silvisoli]
MPVGEHEEMLRMLNDIREAVIIGLVVLSFSRLSRNPEEIKAIVQTFQTHKTRLILVSKRGSSKQWYGEMLSVFSLNEKGLTNIALKN